MFILKNESVCVAGEGGRGGGGRLYDHFLSFVFMGVRIQQLNMSYPQNSICNFPMTHQYSKCTLISQASFCVFWSGHKLTNILRYCHAKIERKCMQSGVSCLCIQQGVTERQTQRALYACVADRIHGEINTEVKKTLPMTLRINRKQNY